MLSCRWINNSFVKGDVCLGLLNMAGLEKLVPILLRYYSQQLPKVELTVSGQVF